MKEFNDYPLETEGVWQIYGEDPNCDMMGHHHEPDLGLVKGRYIDAIVYAKGLSNFTQWGGGGRIVKYNAPHIEDIAGHADNILEEYYRDLKTKRNQLRQELKEIEEKLTARE